MFEFDVALSFAGEQRPEAKRVADLLVAAKLRVFYDDIDEVKAHLWGRDLYQHFSDVYQNKAQYCIIFVSKEYASKAWTSIELKSAQARVFQEKGSDYILPVRFDGTAVPGLLPTVGYLDYHKEGPERICHLFLQKLGAKPGTAPAIPVQAIRCDLSDRAQILSQALNQESYPVVSASAWDQEIELSVLPNVSSDAAFFDALRNHSELVIVAYGFNVALARCVGSKQVSEHGKRFWTLRFRPERTEFASNFEMGSGETPVERYAEMRLRRLLLDEYPMPNFSAENLVTTANQAMHESLLQGTNSLVKIEHCIFPNLYAALSSTPERFIEIAWIQAISMAKLSAAVEQVQQLHLILTGDILGISFVGIRHRKYTNVLPHRIEITGSLSLAKPVRV